MNEDGDSPIQNQENNLVHVDVDEEHNLVEITDLEEAEDISNIQNVSIVTAQITMNVIAQRTSSEIGRNVVPTSDGEKRNMLKDRQLGLQHLRRLQVKRIRPMKDFHRQPDTK